MLLSLIWKESREHFWKMAALLAMMLVPMCAIHLGWSARDANPLDETTVFIASFISPVWIAAWTVAGEKRSRTLSTLLVLPGSRTLVFSVKCIAGLITLLVPLAIGLWISYSWNSHFDEMWSHDSFFFVALFSSATLYLMILACAMSLRSESSVGMVGVLMLVFCYLWLFLLAVSDHGYYSVLVLLIGNPFLILTINEPQIAVGGPALVVLFQAVGAALWFIIALRRFGHATVSTSRAELPQLPTIKPATISPMKHPRYALIWKEWCEQRWTIIGCFSAGIVLTMVAGLLSDFQRPRSDTELEYIIRSSAESMIVLSMVLSCVAAVVLGVGSFTIDLEPALTQFWQSQPISIPSWFWTKYLVSLTGICALLTSQIALAYLGVFMLSLNDVQTDGLRDNAFTTLTAGLILLPFVHAVSILCASLVRRPIYAAILAIIVSISLAACRFSNNSWTVGDAIFSRSNAAVFAVCAVVITALSIAMVLTSVLSLKKNWYIG